MEPNKDKIKKLIISFSGGKDSVGCYLTAVREFPEHEIELIFTDTGDEMPETYDYLRWFDQHIHPVVRLAQKLVKRSEKGRRSTELMYVPWEADVKDFPDLGYITIFSEIRERFSNRPESPPWPSNGIRFCTRALKINLFYRYIRNNYSKREREHLLIVKGMREKESVGRQGKQVWYEDEEGGDIYLVWLAVYYLDVEQIFDLHRHYRVKINPVYAIRSRSNCVGCPFASAKDLHNTLQIYPDSLDEYKKIEQETGYTWHNGMTIEEYAMKGEGMPEDETLSCASGYCDI